MAIQPEVSRLGGSLIPEPTPDKYTAWITQHVPPGCHIVGKCFHYCDLMRRAFPELVESIGGWVNCERNATWPHCYLLAPDGSIVDPTAGQFERIDGYGQFAVQGGCCTGVCPECGNLVWNWNECCTGVPSDNQKNNNRM